MMSPSRARAERTQENSVLLGWAAAEGRTLVTMDKDFGQLVFLEAVKHCGMSKLRPPALAYNTQIGYVLTQIGYALYREV